MALGGVHPLVGDLEGGGAVIALLGEVGTGAGAHLQLLTVNEVRLCEG